MKIVAPPRPNLLGRGGLHKNLPFNHYQRPNFFEISYGDFQTPNRKMVQKCLRSCTAQKNLRAKSLSMIINLTQYFNTFNVLPQRLSASVLQ